MTKDTRYRTNPVVSFGNEEDGAVLFNPDSDETAIINVSGRMLWHYLQSPHTVAEMARYLREQYPDATLEQVSQDVDRFVKELATVFLLENAADD